MHDERRRIEERVERVHDQRIKPAVYAATVPFDGRGLAGAGRAGALRGGRGRRRTSPSRWAPRGARPGAPPGSGCAGEVPAEWAGRRVEAVFDLGFVGDWPGNQAEALVHLAGRHAR